MQIRDGEFCVIVIQSKMMNGRIFVSMLHCSLISKPISICFWRPDSTIIVIYLYIAIFFCGGGWGVGD